MKKYGVPRNIDSEEPDVDGVKTYGSKSSDCGKKYQTSSEKRRVRRNYKHRARQKEQEEIESQLDDFCDIP